MVIKMSIFVYFFFHSRTADAFNLWKTNSLSIYESNFWLHMLYKAYKSPSLGFHKTCKNATLFQTFFVAGMPLSFLFRFRLWEYTNLGGLFYMR